jgi:prepilin-type N-terminal cleavage/methylation domain-containing protein
MKKNFFTLLELLVVVAVIGILVSILMPSLHKARESARRAVCGSNMSQCGQAISMYTVDWNQYMPATDGGGKRKNGVLRKGGDNSEWKTTPFTHIQLIF